MDYDNFLTEIARWLLELSGINYTNAGAREAIAIMVLSLLTAMLTYVILRYCVFGILKKIVAKTKTKIDDVIFNDKVLNNMSLIFPTLVLIVFGRSLQDSGLTYIIYNRIVHALLAVFVMTCAVALVKALFSVMSKVERFKRYPLDGFYQLISLVLYSIGAIYIVAALINKSPAGLIAGLGASAAILSLVFKDTIVGFVSGIQLSANKMLAKGDWITVAGHNADGVVTEVTLNTVKIQNWDNTITTIPPTVLMQSSFSNWKGMQDSGGRRITTSIYIDMSTIRFCSQEELESLKEMPELKDYLEERHGERETNLKLYRKYLLEQLKVDSRVNHDMTYMVRCLDATPQGLPLEVYCFIYEKRWEYYEEIQADMTDHMIATLPMFGLKIFQRSSSGSQECNEMLKVKIC